MTTCSRKTIEGRSYTQENAACTDPGNAKLHKSRLVSLLAKSVEYVHTQDGLAPLRRFVRSMGSYDVDNTLYEQPGA